MSNSTDDKPIFTVEKLIEFRSILSDDRRWLQNKNTVDERREALRFCLTQVAPLVEENLILRERLDRLPALMAEYEKEDLVLAEEFRKLESLNATLVEENRKLREDDNQGFIELQEEIARLKKQMEAMLVEEEHDLHEAELVLENIKLKALNATYRRTLERIADPTPSIGRPSFRDYELREIARQALANGEGMK